MYGATSDGRFTRKLGRPAMIMRRNGPTFNSVTVNQSGPRASWLSVPTSTGREADSAPRTYRYTRRPHTEREGITATTQDLPVAFALTLKALAARSSAASGNGGEANNLHVQLPRNDDKCDERREECHEDGYL